MKSKIILLILIFSQNLSAQHLPFPQHVKYTPGSIKPNHQSQQQLDNSVRGFYAQWKSIYIKHACTPGQNYVWFQKPGIKQCVSEGQGYGMMIVALMAGADPNAKTTFDGLYRFYKAHPARPGNHLMAWAQDRDCKSTDNSSATDGDIDIAYALLLADKQWGSLGSSSKGSGSSSKPGGNKGSGSKQSGSLENSSKNSGGGTINYLQEARLFIGDIMQYEINQNSYSILLSNGSDGDSKDYYDSRSSDFMPSHFRAFKAATKDGRWDKVINNAYQLFIGLQNKYSFDAGLVPDFIQQVNHNPHPAKAHYLESKYDGYYNYNACRVPWRIAADYLLYRDTRAKTITTKINYWLRETTRDNPDNISAGYSLAGNDLPTRHFEALSFIGPFGVSAMVDSKNQHWLNSVWDYLLHFKLKDYDYYDNSIKLITMIIMSGNYWGPQR